MHTATIAALTFVEALRRRVVALGGGLLLAVAGASMWSLDRLRHAHPHGQPISAFELHSIAAIILVFLAYIFSVVLALSAAFLSSTALAGDIESGVFLAILPRPIARAEVVLGKWLGLVMIVALFAVAFGAIEIAIFAAFTGYTPPYPALALGFLTTEAVVSITLGIALSARVPVIAAGIGAVAGFGISWIAGITAMIARTIGNRGIEDAATAVGLLLPGDFLWRGTVFALEPAAVLTLSNATPGAVAGMGPFAVSGPPPAATLIWTALWIVAVLGIAIATFGRRDI